MSKQNHLFIATITAAGLALNFPVASYAEEKSGSETVELTYIFAVQNTGSPAPSMDASCKEKYGSHLGSKVTSKYNINTTTLIMSSESMVFSVPVQLHPLGISGIYSFMSDGVGEQLEKEGVHRVIFSISTNYDNPESDIMLNLDDSYNCILSNKESS